jgi:hypothetical protein
VPVGVDARGGVVDNRVGEAIEVEQATAAHLSGSRLVGSPIHRMVSKKRPRRGSGPDPLT